MLDDEGFLLLNQIKKEDEILDIELTVRVLHKLLNTKGIQFAMAFKILRFKSPKIYQLIDQRVYRFINGEDIPSYFSSTEKQIELYISNLQKLRQVCIEKRIDFTHSDRIIYELDKTNNKGISLKNYGASSSVKN